MKRLCIFIPFILLVAACSKKSNTTPAKVINLNIVGRWTFTADTLKNFVNGVHQTNEDYIVPVTYNPYFEFNSNGMGSENFHDSVQDSLYFSYTVKDSTITLNFPSQYADNEQESAATVPASIEKLNSTSLYIILKYYNSGVINNKECISMKKDD
jgi:hypothetical protein